MKSAIYTANTATQTVPAGGTVSIGSVIRKTGCCLLSDSISVKSLGGLYSVSVNVTAAPTAAGEVTVTLYRNGVAVPGASATQTVAASGTASLAFTALVKSNCCTYDDPVTYTLVLSGTESSVTGASMAVVQV